MRTIVNIRLDYPVKPSPVDKLIGTVRQIAGELARSARTENDPTSALLHLHRYLRELHFNFSNRAIPILDLPNYLSALAIVSDELNPVLINGGLPDVIKSFENTLSRGKTPFFIMIAIVDSGW